MALLLFLQGVFGGGKVAPGTVSLAPGRPDGRTRVFSVVRREVEEVMEWPGTVRSRREAQIAPKLIARISELRVDVGSPVRAGDVLVVLDDRDLRTKIGQARAALAAAEAQEVQSDAEGRRTEVLFEKQAATQRELDGARARAKAARAQVEEARGAVAESEVLLTESVLQAPFEGVITEKWAQAGDTAVPGKPVLTLQDPGQLRLEAQVPESCARIASVGMRVAVRVDSLDGEATARIEEISPVADPGTRTFLVKAALSAREGLRPGMFGRLRQACGHRSVVLVPPSALIRSGQLEMVRILEGGQEGIRHIRSGKSYDGMVEILSGLREGDQVLVRDP